jgi:nucleoid DNA-binding protein
MTERELVTALTSRIKMDEQEIKSMLNTFAFIVSERLEAYDVVDISLLGCFEVKKYDQYISINQSDNKRFLVPPLFSPVFRSYIIDFIETEKLTDL